MWIFMNDSFVSAVEDKEDDRLLVIRARHRSDLEKLFQDREILETEDSDYRFRTWVAKSAFAGLIGEKIRNIDYGNFKNSIAKTDAERKKAYTKVWVAMNSFQEHFYGVQNWISEYLYRRYLKDGSAFLKSETESEDDDYEYVDVYDEGDIVPLDDLMKGR